MCPDEDAHGEVLIDHEHRSAPQSSSVFAAVALELGIALEVGVERSLELHEVARGDPQQDLATFGGDAWITGSAPAPAFLEKVFANRAHGFHSAVAAP